MNSQLTQHSQAWLDVLETELRTQPLHIFTLDEWCILSHLPASQHWRLDGEAPLQYVIEETYRVTRLEKILERIDDPVEKAWWSKTYASSPVLCTSMRLRNEIGTLLTKLVEMPRDQESNLGRLVDLSYKCFVRHGGQAENSPEFSKALAVLQDSPIWLAYTSIDYFNHLTNPTRGKARKLRMQMEKHW